MEQNENNRVLVVEDNQDVGECITDILECEGLEVRWIREPGLHSTWEDALDHALDDHVALVLMDCDLEYTGDGKGRVLARYIHARNPPRPLMIFMSSHSIEEVANDLLREGAIIDFLPKPFDIERLLAAIRAAFTVHAQLA